MTLDICNISKEYGSKKALDCVNLSFTEGIYGLLGPNGAGKSTLMNIITYNLSPSSGHVMWDNQDIHSLGVKYRSLLGYAPQQQGLYDTFTGKRFLSYMATLKNIKKSAIKAEVERTLAYVNMTDKANQLIGSYSGGMKQRILIAQAILGDPKIVILDEPTAGLDPKERVRIRENIKDISDGRIIIISTHVVSDIQSIAKDIILLKSGQVVDVDSVENLCTKFGVDNDLEQVYMKIYGEDAVHDSTN